MNSKIRWGVLSTAKIGTEKVIPAIQQCQHGAVVAIASRNGDRAAQVAASLGIEKSFAGYEQLLADPDIDAIYNPLPNHLHVPWTLKAMAAGKHVLCEKPIGLNVAEAHELADAAASKPALKVMEAFMYRFHPQWQKTKELVDNGTIGDLLTIQTFFSYYSDDAANIRHNPEMGGGGLMDIGCYPISQARFMYGREPSRVFATLDYDETFKVDRVASAILDFAGATATFTCSMSMHPFQRVQLIGTQGRIEVKIPVNTPPEQEAVLTVEHGGDISELKLPVCDQYTLQADALAMSILNDTAVPVSLQDAVMNMQVIDAAVASHQRGGWVSLQ